LGTVDEIALDVNGTVLERLDSDTVGTDPALAQAADAEDDDAPVGPIALAMDTDEPSVNAQDPAAP
jgi:exoribonuclease-2